VSSAGMRGGSSWERLPGGYEVHHLCLGRCFSFLLLFFFVIMRSLFLCSKSLMQR